MIYYLELSVCVMVVLNIITAGVMTLLNEDIKTIRHLLWAILGTVLLIMRGF